MKAINLLLFYICLNLSAWLIVNLNITNLQLTFNTPAQLDMNSKLVGIFGGTVTGLVITALGYQFVGAAVLILTALSWFYEPLQMIFYGFPNMLMLLGVPSLISTIISVLVNFTIFVWIFAFMAGKPVET